MPSPPEKLRSWRRLAKLAERGVASEGGRLALSRAASSATVRSLGVRVGPLLVELSRQGIGKETLAALVELAQESQLPDAVEAQFRGDRINATEDRAVLHTALRAPAAARPASVADEIEREQRRMLDFAEALRSGRRVGCTGRPIRTLVHVGIGGSHLGPHLVCEALASPPGRLPPDIRFLANIDGHAAATTLAGLDPETTFFAVVSKSFGTEETLANAAAARSWLLERTLQPKALVHHFAAITANVEAAREFGIAPDTCFPMSDSVGGRFSVWSAVGLPVAARIGRQGFVDFLGGAHRMDRHFRSAPVERNAPMLLALVGLLNANFRGASSHAVLAYDGRLRRLPDYLQQLEMESNGKSVRTDGEASAVHTAPVIWGGEETNGQHAFHQLLHQGTRTVSADLVAVVNPAHRHLEQHERLLAHCLAQGEALELGDNAEDPHRRTPGNRPTTTILLDELTPHALGALLALYEHKVFCAGRLLQVNSFDQWGVELGKRLAAPVRQTLATGVVRPETDPTTAALLDAIRGRRLRQ
ncbi:MAG: glucose-6-phosphate isomerase [Gammaproteobacteria bacterium]|nr:glucose-6-phosphate isomerase [Gammaproteobacteria bacterium]